MEGLDLRDPMATSSEEEEEDEEPEPEPEPKPEPEPESPPRRGNPLVVPELVSPFPHNTAGFTRRRGTESLT